jgi:hypothetical protein
MLMGSTKTADVNLGTEPLVSVWVCRVAVVYASGLRPAAAAGLHAARDSALGSELCALRSRPMRRCAVECRSEVVRVGLAGRQRHAHIAFRSLV